MKKFNLTDALAIILWLLPIVYLIAVYANLPQKVPLHYGISGKPDRYGDKSEMILLQCILSAVGAGVYLLLSFITSIDPKKKAQYSEATFKKMGVGVLILLVAINLCIIYATLNGGIRFDKVVLPLIGLFFAFLGNIMYSIKPNYFAGVRTPWTLEDEGNWRATHQLAGKLWVAGGIVLTILTLVLPQSVAFIVFISGIIIISLYPVIFSYLYYKKHGVK
jgi:uncharacterized membrane protein